MRVANIVMWVMFVIWMVGIHLYPGLKLHELESRIEELEAVYAFLECDAED